MTEQSTRPDRAGGPQQTGSTPGQTAGKFLRENATLIALFVIGLVLAFQSEAFLTPRNLNNVALQVTIIGVVAVGMTMVILIAGIDLSVGSVVGLAAVTVAWLMHEGVGVWPAVLLTLAGGLVVGLWNGFWISRYKIPSFIITLGMMTIARGLSLSLSGASSIPITDQTFPAIGGAYLPVWLSLAVLGAAWLLFVYRVLDNVRQRRKYHLDIHRAETALRLVVGTVGLGLAAWVFGSYRGLPVPVAIFAVVAVAGAFILRNTRFGRRLYAMGGNAEAARLSGIDTRRMTLAVFAIIAVLASVAGIILASRLNGASPNLGTMLELDVIAAVVIGGTSLMGGIGTVGGTVIGVFLIGVLENGMSLEDVNEFYRLIVKGLIIIVAVWFDVVSKRKKA